MIKILLLTGLFFFTQGLVQAVFVTGFGTGDFSITYTDFTTNQTATYLDIDGTDFADQLNGNFTPVSVSSNLTQLLLTATNIGGAPASEFSITLFDAANNKLEYDGYWNSFPLNTPATVTLNLTSADSGWNGTAIKLQISTGGLGSPIKMRLDELSVIPEPNVFVLIFLGIPFVFALHRTFNIRKTKLNDFTSG